MIALVIVLALFLGLAMVSSIHALGLWLAMMVIHGVLVMLLGDAAKHIPLYAGVMIAVIILARGKWSGVNRNVLSLFGILVVVMIFAAFQGINLTNSMLPLMLYAKVFILALLVAGCVKNEHDIKIMLLYCLAALLIGALYAVYQYLTGTFSINVYDTQRAAGLRGDPNETAMLLVAGVPIAVYWALNSTRKIHKLFFATCLPLLLIGIVLTGSRGGFVALLFIMFLAYMRRPTIKLTIAGIFMMIAVGIFAPASYWERMQTLVEGESDQYASLDGRKLLLATGINMVLQYPVLGVGSGNFGAMFIEMNSDSGLHGSSGRHKGVEMEGGKAAVAHNLYLEFFAENGFIGGILLLSIFMISLRHLVAYDHATSVLKQQFGLGFSVALALTGMLFAGLFLSQGKNSVLWFLVGLGLAAGQLITVHKRNATSIREGKQVEATNNMHETTCKSATGVRLRKANKS